MGTVPHLWVDIHTTAAPQPSIPPWFAETVLIASYLRSQGLLETLNAQVHLVRGRFGQYEALDFMALLFGYAISGERTLQAFFDRLRPFAEPFMALFERGTLPHRSTLSRFLADVDLSCLHAQRTAFATSSFVWGWTQETIGGLWDRSGSGTWSSILMPHAKRPVSASSPSAPNFRSPSDVSTRCVARATWDTDADTLHASDDGHQSPQSHGAAACRV